MFRTKSKPAVEAFLDELLAGLESGEIVPGGDTVGATVPASHQVEDTSRQASGAGLSIIIPAHNEASVIAATLQSIMSNSFDRPLQVIVVANGCTDQTAEVVRQFGNYVELVETPVGSKVHALNLGDRVAKYDLRAYLDADIELSDNALQTVVDAFKDSTVRLAKPRARHTYRGRNPFLAGYYHLWRSMPYVRKGAMRGGFYAIDKELRSRFREFPSLTADDQFLRNLARPHERRVVDGCYATVTMPQTFGDLLKVKTRWTYGDLELAALRPDLNYNDQHKHEGALKCVMLRPWLWVHVPAFVFVYFYAQFAARKRFALKQAVWERDESTRPFPAPAQPNRAQNAA
jgi:cellulose synthase/poly-beta-1,6-N-acetylglucosamine synthase-like glycosyltransferase